jgi:multidrug efflux pump subunit AcrA (membrane-fusion protein)
MPPRYQENNPLKMVVLIVIIVIILSFVASGELSSGIKAFFQSQSEARRENMLTEQQKAEWEMTSNYRQQELAAQAEQNLAELEYNKTLTLAQAQADAIVTDAQAQAQADIIKAEAEANGNRLAAENLAAIAELEQQQRVKAQRETMLLRAQEIGIYVLYVIGLFMMLGFLSRLINVFDQWIKERGSRGVSANASAASSRIMTKGSSMVRQQTSLQRKPITLQRGRKQQEILVPVYLRPRRNNRYSQPVDSQW